MRHRKISRISSSPRIVEVPESPSALYHTHGPQSGSYSSGRRVLIQRLPVLDPSGVTGDRVLLGEIEVIAGD